MQCVPYFQEGVGEMQVCLLREGGGVESQKKDLTCIYIA
jgi:hypothetical protein